MGMKPGIRVVRGPHWTYGNEDGGEGQLGTVTGIPGPGPNYGKVQVVWDSISQERTYYAGRDNRFELRIYEMAPTGVKHQSSCDACNTGYLTGIRWKCLVCSDFDVCSQCYHNDQHDRSHSFMRYVTDDCKLAKVPPRNASSKKHLYGLVEGAEVQRGFHWTFGNQDGGMGKRGKILEVSTHNGGHYQGGVRVQWDHSPDNIMHCRVGADGKVELVAKTKVSAGTYYPDHLPRLDIINPDNIHLKRGDKVKVDVDQDTFKKLQKGNLQGGWHEDMKQCQEEIGTIVSVSRSGLLRVQYEDARTWTIVRSVVQRLSSFSKGDIVRIIDGYNAAVELQVGHGGWNEKMEEALGKTAKVVEIDDDGDLKIESGGRCWLFSPVSCTVLYDADFKLQDGRTSDTLHDDEVRKGESRNNPDVSSLLSFIKDNQVAEFFQAADHGDLHKVKYFVAKNPGKINVHVQGKIALHVACYHGYTDIIDHLFNSGADHSIADGKGDTCLHYAVSGEQVGVLEELCKRGVEKNARNKAGLTALHKAVVDRLEECVDILVSHGANINTQDKELDSPMHEALKTRQQGMVKTLLKSAQLDGSLANREKLNIMHFAVIHGQQRVVESLILRDKMLASTTGGQDCWAPLHLAAMNGQTAIAGILVKKGDVQVDVVDGNGRTALHYAVQSCENTIIDLLLGREADPNVQDKDGNTPAHLAQMAKLPTAGQKKSEEDVLVQSILCMLAECGADLHLKNKEGETSLDLCRNPQLVRKLLGIADRVKSERHVKDDIPPHWTPMQGKELVVQELQHDDPLTQEEYDNVSNKFLRSMANVDVISIKRIQNRSLWDAYNVSKKTMERKYGLGCANELNLFHGTLATCVEPIQHQNIDPLLAGNNIGAIWGNGAYFAIDSKISDNYASASDEGYRYMFITRVLAGRTAQGSKGLQRPPPVDPAMPNELADAVVDNVDSPKVYVIFRNQQIYPEFLVQYE